MSIKKWIFIILLFSIWYNLDHPTLHYLAKAVLVMSSKAGYFDNSLGISPEAYGFQLIRTYADSFLEEKNMTVMAKRKALQFSMKNFISPNTRVIVEERMAKDVHLRMFHDHSKDIFNDTKATTVLYLHGGGFISGDIEMYSGIASEIAARELRVILPEYRLCPENSIVDALDDVLVAYQWILESLRMKSNRISIVGDSAGGGLAMLLIHKIKELNLPLPGSCVLISPWLDYSKEYSESSGDILLNGKSLNFFRTNLNTGGKTLRELSPLYYPVEDIHVPIMVIGGDLDPVFDEGEQLVQKLKDSGKKVDYLAKKNLYHDFPLTFHFVPEANDAIIAMTNYIWKNARSKSHNPNSEYYLQNKQQKTKKNL